MEGADELVDIGGGRRYMSDRPSQRFPIYTRGNAGEVYPEPYYPLSWSLTAADGGAVFESASRQSGILGAEDFAEDAAVSSGVFAGYAYLNLSLSRVGAIRMPGAGLDDVDRAMLGGADLPPHVAQKGDKNLLASLPRPASRLAHHRHRRPAGATGPAGEGEELVVDAPGSRLGQRRGVAGRTPELQRPHLRAVRDSPRGVGTVGHRPGSLGRDVPRPPRRREPGARPHQRSGRRGLGRAVQRALGPRPARGRQRRPHPGLRRRRR